MGADYKKLLEDERETNIHLREELIKKTEELIESMNDTLKIRDEKQELLQKLIERDGEFIESIEDYQIFLRALNRIFEVKDVPCSIIAGEALKHVADRIVSRQGRKKKD